MSLQIAHQMPTPFTTRPLSQSTRRRQSRSSYRPRVNPTEFALLHRDGNPGDEDGKDAGTLIYERR